MANLHRETFELRQHTMDQLRDALTAAAFHGSLALAEIGDKGVLPLASGQVQFPDPSWRDVELTLYNFGALASQPTFHLEFRQSASHVNCPDCTITPRYGILSDGTTVWGMNGGEYINIQQVVDYTIFTRERAETARQRLETDSRLDNLAHRLLLKPETMWQKAGRLLGQAAMYAHPLGNWPQ